MPLSNNEKMIAEAIDSMLQQDAKLGLSIHDSTEDWNSEERGYEYLHNQVDDLFRLKAAELVHAESVSQAFGKVHNYKYIDDPSFPTAMEKEMVATAVPSEEREKALGFIPNIIKELREEQKQWSEKDFGYNPNLEDIREASRPEQPLDFNIHDVEGYNDGNVEWEKGDASPGHTPSD